MLDGSREAVLGVVGRLGGVSGFAVITRWTVGFIRQIKVCYCLLGDPTPHTERLLDQLVYENQPLVELVAHIRNLEQRTAVTIEPVPHRIVRLLLVHD